jgi:hypothetical protein
VEHAQQTQMAMVSVMMPKYWVARMLKLATTNPLPRKTMALVQNWMNVEFAAATASLKALVTAKEVYWTSAEFAAVMALLKVHATAMVLCLPTVMIALAFA